MKEHKIPIGTCVKPTSLTDATAECIPWHNLTQTEVIFVSTYFTAKGKMIANQFIRVAMVVLVVELLLTFSVVSKHVLFVTSIVLLISFLVLKIYTATWSNVNTSAQCAYYPICGKFSLKRNNYVSISVDDKIYSYILDGEPHSYYVMVVNFNGLSCVINSKSLPCDTQRKDLV
jgi:hypothetical protein